MKTFTHRVEFEDENNAEIELDIEYTVTWGEDAHINCLPEDATPASHDDVDIISVKANMDWRGVLRWQTSELDDHWSHAESIADELIEAAKKELSE